MTERTKFKIYVRRGGKLKVKAKPKVPKPKNRSAVEFVLRHVGSRAYNEATVEAARLLKIVDHTSADRAVIEQVLKSRCQKSQ